MTHSKNKKQHELDTTISHLDITEAVYNSLTSLDGTNEEENSELNMSFNGFLQGILDKVFISYCYV